MAIESVDVTDKVDFGINDDESLPLTTCVCGAAFETWSQIMGMGPERPWTCPQCGAKLFFRLSIRVFQVRELT